MGYHIVILAGGSGTRLWPLSRKRIPKHLLPIHPAGITLLSSTVMRVRPLGAEIAVITAASQVEACREALREDGVDAQGIRFIVEPDARGTGPALGLAMAHIARDDPEAIVSSVHADHYIDDDDAYCDAVVNAARVAQQGGLATVGVVPTGPATGFGYISCGKEVSLPDMPEHSMLPLRKGLAVFQAEHFIEKPSHEAAAALLASGHVLWNTGLFAWKLSTFQKALFDADERIAGTVADVAALQREGRDEEAREAYQKLVPVAVDPLIMERATNLSVVEAAFHWSDMGSWSDLRSIWEQVGRSDAAGNIITGDGLVHDATGCFVHASGGRFVAVIGADDVVVIDMEDAVLVLSSEHAQKVKHIVERLQQDRREELL